MKIAESQRARFDAEVRAHRADFDRINRRRKRQGKPLVQTCYGGSWAHEMDFLRRHK